MASECCANCQFVKAPITLLARYWPGEKAVYRKVTAEIFRRVACGGLLPQAPSSRFPNLNCEITDPLHTRCLGYLPKNNSR